MRPRPRPDVRRRARRPRRRGLRRFDAPGGLLVRSARGAAERPVLAPGGCRRRSGGTDRDRRRHGGDLDLRIRSGGRRKADRRPPCAIPRGRAEPGPQRFGRHPQRVQPEGPAGGRLRRGPGRLRAPGRRNPAPTRHGPGPVTSNARPGSRSRSTPTTSARRHRTSSRPSTHTTGSSSVPSVRTRGKGDAVASFDLLIPSARLDDALAAFSDIGPVSSRSDASVDVTAPTIGLEERAQDSKAKIESLLRELSRARERYRAGIGRSGAALRAQSARPGAVEAQLPAASHSFLPGLAADRVGPATAPAPAPGASATPPRTRHGSWASPQG